MASSTTSLLGERPSARYVLRRCLGGAFDFVVLVGLITALFLRSGQPTDDGSVQVSGLPALLVPVFWVCYFPLMEALFGATLGKLLVDLRVESIAGGRRDTATFTQAFKRHLLDAVDFSFLVLPAAALVYFSPGGQRLGDHWAHTVVRHVKAQPPIAP